MLAIIKFSFPQLAMSDNPDELTAKAKMLIESKGKDRDTVNTAVELYSQAVKLQYASTYFCLLFHFVELKSMEI